MNRLILCLAIVATVAAFPPHFRKGPPPCGLPPYVDEMPEEAKQKVLDIWKNYQEGDKCYEEQGLTREVLDTLTKEQRRDIFKGAFMPPFLKKAPKDVQEQFKAVFKDRSIPFEQKPQKFKELAEKLLSGDLLAEFNKFHEKMESSRAEFNEKVSKLSTEAKSAYEKIEKLEAEKREIFHSVTDEARDELFELFKERFAGRGGFGGRGHH